MYTPPSSCVIGVGKGHRCVVVVVTDSDDAEVTAAPEAFLGLEPDKRSLETKAVFAGAGDTSVLADVRRLAWWRAAAMPSSDRNATDAQLVRLV